MRPRELCRFGWIDLSRLESVLYNVRYVQHHVAHLNLIPHQVVNQSSR